MNPSSGPVPQAEPVACAQAKGEELVHATVPSVTVEEVEETVVSLEHRVGDLEHDMKEVRRMLEAIQRNRK